MKIDLSKYNKFENLSDLLRFFNDAQITVEYIPTDPVYMYPRIIMSFTNRINETARSGRILKDWYETMRDSNNRIYSNIILYLEVGDALYRLADNSPKVDREDREWMIEAVRQMSETARRWEMKMQVKKNENSE